MVPPSRIKSTMLYKQVRRALRSGRFVPGDRIEPGLLASEFKTSPTPVRLALHRLAGEGLLVDCERDGFRVPRSTELELHQLYDWMERLLLMACDIGLANQKGRAQPLLLEPPSPDEDLVKLTWKLFDAIAKMAPQPHLQHAIKLANDQLAPIRRAKQGFLDHSYEELADIHIRLLHRDFQALEHALAAYHLRRQRLVPDIVAMLNQATG